MKYLIFLISSFIFVVFLFFLVYDVLGFSDDIFRTLIIAIWAFSIIIGPFIFIGIKNKRAEVQGKKMLKIAIPEKIGIRSHIDDKSGKIYLRSDDFHTYGGETWEINKKSISIRLNNDSNLETIPISKIKKVEFDPEAYYLSFSIPDTSINPHFPTSGEITKSIFFNPSDLHIAEVAHDRVTGK